uniref:Uncharacterized protein n=1 Tax=Globisporangium ultimum (strain ATCC 200006 / CBS 805.95 / DAOM BR144) TaxID=431595 RepID=K3WAY9_GLOUD
MLPAVTTAADSLVAAASFCRLECDHKELFQPEYKRSNRTKGLKILRCFPHCCPNHMDRSYCGSSLHVLVRTTPTSDAASQLSQAQASPDGVGELSVFARFESASDPGMELGECVSFDSVTATTQSEENPEGQWIPGVKERPPAPTAVVKHMGNLGAENALVYQLNGKIYSRWYYDWESGANKAQRLMKHVLKAYVFEKIHSSSSNNSSDGEASSPYLYRVVAVIVSPEFTVISYRRAPSEVVSMMKSESYNYNPSHNNYNHGNPVLPPSAPRHLSPTSGDRNKRSAMDAMEGSNRWQLDELQSSSLRHQDMDPRMMKRRRPVGAVGPTDSFLRSSGASSVSVSSPLLVRGIHNTSSLFEDKVMWEHTNSTAVTTSKNLALLYWFVQWTPLTCYASFVDELVHITHRRLLEPLAPSNHHVGKINCFLRVFLEHAEGAGSGSDPHHASSQSKPLPFELETLLRVVSQAALWFFSEETRQWIRLFFQQHAENTLNKQALRRSFLIWITETEERLNHHVFAMTSLKTLTNVAEEIIAAVYSYEMFHSKRPQLRQILGDHGFAGWNAFVAQIRDTYIASSGVGNQSTTKGSAQAASFVQMGVVRNMFEQGWNGEWLLDTEEAVWKPTTTGSNSRRDPVSLFTMFDLISQITRLELVLSVQERILRVRSANTIMSGFDSMRLVLDGQERLFRVFPNGVSSSVNDGSCGDYIGSMHMESKGKRLVVYLELFRWAMTTSGSGASDPSYHMRMRIECWRNHRLYVNGEVLQTTSASSFADEERPYLGEMKLRAKRKAISKAHARHFHASVPSSSSVPMPAAWKQMGRFRLSYHRLA